MLSIAKLRVGQEAYQLSGVAQSLDAYYTGSGETAGAWVGGGSARLGLDGDVDADDLRAVLAGIAPGWGGLSPNGETPRSHVRRVPGFDLTFKAPKSASVLYAVSDDPRVQGAVIEAGEVAMRASIGWLEREAIRVRRGSHNQAWIAAHNDEPSSGPRQLATSGVVAASFRHRTSRAGDPLLHWHVLVANLVEGSDGKWSAFTHPELYRHVRAAGELFQSVFRDSLTHSLGVEWRPGRHVPEIAGIPQALLDQFSKRSSEIDAWLAETNTPDTPEGRQAAVLATRRHKPEVEAGRFDEAWKLEAETTGWGPDAAERLVGWSMDRAEVSFDGVWRLDTVGFDEHGNPEHYERLVDQEEWIADLLRSELTAHQSTFTEADLVQAVAARQGGGATVETIERVANRVLASEQVVAIADDLGKPALWTSRELLDIEARFINALTHIATTAPLPEPAIELGISGRETLGDDQRAAADAITRGGSAVSVLVGPAGTGKTYTLDTIRACLEQAGHHVTGAAPSARAAIELAAGANIASSTLHSLLDRWNNGHDSPTPASLLVIDEAGMADIRTLETVVTRQLAAGGRVLLVGDQHHLPELGAGGGFAYAATHARTVAELSVNRRQREAWEHDALTQLRNGSVAAAVEAYLAHDRVIATDTPDAMIATAVDTWFDARSAGLNPVLLAGTNDLVDRLNAAVIQRLTDNGELDDTASVTFGASGYRIGERVVARRNSTEHTTTGHTIDLANGQAGTITSVADNQLTVRLDRDGDEVVLTDRYLRRGGHVTHAYALTTHRAQGGTWDLAISVGADGLYRESAYVVLSRGIHQNWIILTNPEAAELHRQAVLETERHDTGITPSDQQPDDTETDLTTRINRSHAKHLAHALDPDAELIDHLSRSIPLSDLEAHIQRGHSAERIATEIVGVDGHQVEERFARIDHVARHIALGHQVSPHDRHNVGTVVELDDHAGTVEVHFLSTGGREAIKMFDWEELRIVEPRDPQPRTMTSAGAERLADIASQLGDIVQRWKSTVQSFDVEPGDIDRYQRAIHGRIERDTNTLAAAQPDWLQHVLGDRPSDVAGAHTWDDAVAEIAHWRAQHDTPTTIPGLGTRPHEAREDEAWSRLHLRLGVTRTWLTSTDRIEQASKITSSVAELNERRGQLDTILAGAPTDYRETISRLRSGQLSFDDTTELLQTALDGQAARRSWIVEHWPHVVEYQEINRAMTTAWMVDTPLLASHENTDITDSLAAAIDM